MDDSCAVCADTLEWVAYGACGHRDVCSTCVARLRFICEDRRCCICKTECAVVFVTKALGDYTRMVNDFSVFPSEAREGRVGPYWYHEDTQLFFDDVDHYRMIKAMCRLSCSVCDNMEEQPNEGTRRRQRFRNIEQLKGHLFHRHRLSMCGLCLEGRKVFICEQKLYTRAQLNQHVNTGDSEVDGTESERGGFMGHPMCEFCRTPFYGDNELYSHMSTEHYTCHLCQRQHPGQYEYYKNYDDLEIHFRGEHFLCEDEGCLAKKFIVFQSEAEMKRHNAIEHGGRMSRAKRNAVLQIPTSFRFRRNNEDNRRARGRALNRDTAEDQLSMAIQASLETASASGAVNEPSPSSAQPVSNHEDTNDVDPLVQPFESLTTADSETSVRYLQALGHSRNAPLQESSFPPLATGSSSNQQKSSQNSEGLPNNTMAARLRRRNKGNVSVLNSGKAWASTSHGPVQPSNNLTQQRPMTSVAPSTSWSSGRGPNLPGSLSTAHTQPQPQPQPQSQAQAQAQAQARPTTVHGNVSSASLTYSGKTSGISHSASAPNLIDNGSKGRSVSDFPPVSALQIRKLPQSSQPQLKAPSSGQPIPNVEDVQSANRSLVEKMRAAFGYDEDKYTAFKDISGQYRQGLIDTGRYLAYVREYGLTHLVLELARLCPDPEKQKELIDSYNASQESNGQEENGWGHGNIRIKSNNNSKKNKGKSVVVESSKSKDTFADNFLSSVRELQTSFKPAEEATEGLSKDGYRGGKGKSMVSVNEQLRNQIDQSVGGGSNQTSVDRNGGGKQRKKTSKFHRVRLGDGSISSLLDVNNSGSKLDPQPLDGNKSVGDGVPVRGVWRKGGGHKLFS